MVKFNKSLQGKKSALSKQSCTKHVHINKELKEMESLRPLLDLKHSVLSTARNAEGEQCYEASDSITVEIRNHQGQDCATKPPASP